MTFEQICQRLVQQEVRACLSGLVASLANGYGALASSGGTMHNIVPAAAVVGLCEQAAELAAPLLDYEAAAREAGWQFPTDNTFPIARPMTDAERADADDNEGPCLYADDAEDACAQDDIEPHELEVYEHWAVSDWLADQLEERGEKVDRDFAGLTVWARTTTGQMIAADGVIERIARASGYALNV